MLSLGRCMMMYVCASRGQNPTRNILVVDFPECLTLEGIYNNIQQLVAKSLLSMTIHDAPI